MFLEDCLSIKTNYGRRVYIPQRQLLAMDKEQAGKRIKELREILWENSKKYYVENAPTMSDYDYDHLMYELGELEDEYPDLITPDSPTRKVGSDLESRFAQYPHKYPMLSLGNTYNIGEI